MLLVNSLLHEIFGFLLIDENEEYRSRFLASTLEVCLLTITNNGVAGDCAEEGKGMETLMKFSLNT